MGATRDAIQLYHLHGKCDYVPIPSNLLSQSYRAQCFDIIKKLKREEIPAQRSFTNQKQDNTSPSLPSKKSICTEKNISQENIVLSSSELSSDETNASESTPASFSFTPADLELWKSKSQSDGPQECSLSSSFRLFIGQTAPYVSPVVLRWVLWTLSQCDPLQIQTMRSQPSAPFMFCFVSTESEGVRVISHLHRKVLFDVCGVWIARNAEQHENLTHFVHSERSKFLPALPLPRGAMVVEMSRPDRNQRGAYLSNANAVPFGVSAPNASLLLDESQLGNTAKGLSLNHPTELTCRNTTGMQQMPFIDPNFISPVLGVKTSSPLGSLSCVAPMGTIVSLSPNTTPLISLPPVYWVNSPIGVPPIFESQTPIPHSIACQDGLNAMQPLVQPSLMPLVSYPGFVATPIAPSFHARSNFESNAGSAFNISHSQPQIHATPYSSAPKKEMRSELNLCNSSNSAQRAKGKHITHQSIDTSILNPTATPYSPVNQSKSGKCEILSSSQSSQDSTKLSTISSSSISNVTGSSPISDDKGNLSKESISQDSNTKLSGHKSAHFPSTPHRPDIKRFASKETKTQTNLSPSPPSSSALSNKVSSVPSFSVTPKKRVAPNDEPSTQSKATRMVYSSSPRRMRVLESPVASLIAFGRMRQIFIPPSPVIP